MSELCCITKFVEGMSHESLKLPFVGAEAQREGWCQREELNLRPKAYESCCKANKHAALSAIKNRLPDG